MEVNEDLAYILGALRDGSLPRPSNNKFQVTFACDWYKPWITEIVVPKVQKVFNLPSTKIKIYEKWSHKSKRPFFRLMVYSKKLHQLLSRIYPPGNQKNWTTPSIIKNGKLEEQIEYVRGFYDAEGGCRDIEKFLVGKTRSINCELGIRCKHISTPNEPLTFLSSILQKFNIHTHMRKSNDGLVITGKLNVLKFYQIFTPLHLRKRYMIRNLLQYFGVLPSAEA